jgi:sugar lactone lactonase YvrE
MESSNQARQRTNVAKEKTDQSGAKATSPKQSSPKTVKKGFSFPWIPICFGLLAALGFWLYRLPCPIRAIEFKLPPPPPLEGPLAENDIIQKYGKRIFSTRLFGPESIEPCGGALYTGTRDSKIWKLVGETATVIANPGGPKCGRLDAGEDYPDCGRPLGIRCVNDKYLVVADARLGLLRVDLPIVSEPARVTVLLSAHEEVDGFPLHFLDYPVVFPNGSVFVSQVDMFRDFSEMVYTVFEHGPSGRVIFYDPALGTGAKAAKAYAGSLHFPNGMTLTPDGKALLICETTKARITKIWLEGPMRDLFSTFADNLPGMPDNIMKSSDGGYWVAIVLPRHAGIFDMYGFLGRHPLLRTWLSKVLPKAALESLMFYVTGSYVVKLDADGRVVGSLHDPTHYLAGGLISTATEHEGALYLGSFLLNYIVRVDLRAAAAAAAAAAA